MSNHKAWLSSPTAKLLVPIAVMAALLIAMNLLHNAQTPPEAVKFPDRIMQAAEKKVEPVLKRGSKVIEAGLDYAEKTMDQLERELSNP